MPALQRAIRRLVSLFRQSRDEASLARELTAHLARREDDHGRRGPSPAAARREARHRLGGVEQTKELHRDARTFMWVEDARRDAVYAVRGLRRSPAMAATIVASLAIGIGGTTAVFTVANALLLRAPAGLADPERLIDIGAARGGGGGFNPTSYPVYLDVQRRASTVTSVYASQLFPQAISLAIPGRAEPPTRVFGHFVSHNYFAVLGLTPAAGGWFDADERALTVVISDRFRRAWFGDSLPLGRLISVNGEHFSIAGVLPPGFHGSSLVSADLWLPLLSAPAAHVVDTRAFDDRRSGWLVMGGRLRPGASIAAATAELDAIGRDLSREYPSNGPALSLRAAPSSLMPGNRAVTAVLLSILFGLLALVLFVACANVSGVLLARADARRHEIAVRLSIGAARARLIRQLLMETAVLFGLGSVAGIVVARALMNLLIAVLPVLPVPIAIDFPLDYRVLAFTIGLTLVAALLSGLAPALKGSRADPGLALKTESPGSPARTRARNAFVIAQAAISVALVFAAALFARALVRATSSDPGYDPRGVEIVSVDRSLSRAGSDTASHASWRTLLERIRRMPGVESATLARTLPGGFETFRFAVGLPGKPVGQELAAFAPDGNIVEPGYFATMRIPIVAGRDFTDRDVMGAPSVVIVGESAARHYWPGQSAVGQYLSETTPQGTRSLQVVGVVREIRSSTLIDGVGRSLIYLPLQQQEPSFVTEKMTIVARGSANQPLASGIRSVVTATNPSLPVSTTETLRDAVALGLLPQRIVASVAGTLGLASAVLAAIGIYGIAAFAVSRRTREFGIRMALGATRGAILRMVVRQGAGLAFCGATIGVAVGAGIAQVLSGFLFGIPPLDPLVASATAIVFVGIGVAACYGPARRATSIDPLTALKHD
jgi:predicted permease